MGTEDEININEEAVCTSSEKVLEVQGVWVLLCRWNRVSTCVYIERQLFIYLAVLGLSWGM